MPLVYIGYKDDIYLFIEPTENVINASKLRDRRPRMTVCIPIHCVIRSRVRKSRRVHKDNMASREERKEEKKGGKGRVRRFQ